MSARARRRVIAKALGNAILALAAAAVAGLTIASPVLAYLAGW